MVCKLNSTMCEEACHGRSGMIWMEIMVAVSAMGLVILVGMRTLSSLMEFLDRRYDQITRISDLAGFEARIRHAWNHRHAHSFQDVDRPWLVVEGAVGEGGIILREMRLRFLDESGQQSEWRLFTADDQWTESVQGVTDPTESPRIIRLDYRGKILMQIERPVWEPGTVPGALAVSFPDADQERLKVGFAIQRAW